MQTLVLTALVTVLVGTQAASITRKTIACPNGWFPTHTFCYLLHTKKSYSFNDAQSYCQAHNASLASIHTSDTQATLVGAWIDGRD